MINKELIALYSFLAKKSKMAIPVAAIFGVISGASSIGTIALINVISNNTIQGNFTLYLTAYCGLLLARVILGILSRNMLARISQRAILELRLMISRRILATQLSNLETLGSPRILATLTGDIFSISEMLILTPAVCINSAVVVACVVYLSYLSAKLMLLTLFVGVVGTISLQRLVKKGIRYFRDAREKQNVMFKHFRAMIEGIKDLKLNERRRSEFYETQLKTTGDAYKRLNIKARTVYSFAFGLGQFLTFALIGAALFLIPLISENSREIIWGYVLTIVYMSGALMFLIDTFSVLGRAEVAAENIKSLQLGLSPEEENKSHIRANETCDCAYWKHLELVKAVYTYPAADGNEAFAVGPIDFSLKPGEIVFITGGNGSGKSTLAKLITGLYSPASGKVKIDGKSIDTTNIAWYRQHFSTVFTDFYLFDQLMGVSEDKLNNDVEKHLALLNLKQKVSVKQGKISTTALSQGQRKRLALLTALLDDRPIFVFDECVSDQEAAFRKVFYTEIIRTLKDQGKAIIVITHDDRYYSMADRIVKLEYGKIQYEKLVKKDEQVEIAETVVALDLSLKI